MRIPVAVLAAAKIELGQAVDVREEGGRVVIEPVRPRRYDLTELLAGITSENIHDEVKAGPAGGHEFW